MGSLAPVVALAALLAAPPQAVEETFLGFRVGEELHYALEREDGSTELIVQWTIRLDEIDAEAGTGLFDLTYIVQPRRGPRVAQAIADVVVNAYGFPVEIRYTAERITPLGGIGYSIEYLYEEDRYRKELLGGSFKDQEVKLEDYPRIRTSVPSGLYLYTPIDADCARALEVPEPPAPAEVGGEGDDPPQIEETCRGRELIFANPGLLNLTMPALWEAGTGKLDFFALAPTGPKLDLFFRDPNSSSSNPLTISGIPIAALLGAGGPNPFHDGEEALQSFSMSAAADLVQLDLGGRPVDAWKLEVPFPFTALYVDGNGSIARLDLPDDPQTGARSWIRRLRPSEY